MSKNHPDNLKVVYKFWLGLFKKVAVLVLAAVAVPAAVGQLSQPPTLIPGGSGIVLILLVAMMLHSNAIWHLSKNE